jgi:type IV secretory pathway VirB10-like protein
MQRAAFPELQGRPRPPRHRRASEKSDRVLPWLKAATVVAAAGLLGVVILLATAGGGESTARRSPTVPTIIPGGSDDGSRPATTTPVPTMNPPVLLTETAEIAVTPPPATTSSSQPRPTSPQPRTPEFQFAVIGEKCTPVGAFSVTRERQPVVCARRRGDGGRWVPMF